MKKVSLLLVISLFFINCYPQSETSQNLLGSWYHPGNELIKLEIGNSISFSKESSDSLQLEWEFMDNGEFIIRFAMITPDNKDVIRYKNNKAKWLLNDDKGELIIKDASLSKVLKINKLDANRLTVTRIE